MPISETYQAFRRTTGDPPRTVELVTEKIPNNLGAEEVLIKIHAVSLNFRDAAMLNGKYVVKLEGRNILQTEERGIPASDCAAEVVAVGSAVQSRDRVAPIFDLNGLTGEEKGATVSLGGGIPGVLRQYAVFDQNFLVRLPKHLTWEEESLLGMPSACLAPPAKATQHWSKSGTGGVSMFALLICLAAGIHPIITSSSDEKLNAVRKLAPEGAIDTINYKTHPDWQVGAKRLTGGQGVDLVVNNSGPSSLAQDVSSLRRRGTISLVGFLEGLLDTIDPNTILEVLFKTAKIQGINVGSKIDFQDLNNFLEEKGVPLHTIIDRTFDFEDSKAAFDHLYSAKHVGKVVIKL